MNAVVLFGIFGTVIVSMWSSGLDRKRKLSLGSASVTLISSTIGFCLCVCVCAGRENVCNYRCMQHVINVTFCSISRLYDCLPLTIGFKLWKVKGLGIPSAAKTEASNENTSFW